MFFSFPELLIVNLTRRNCLKSAAILAGTGAVARLLPAALAAGSERGYFESEFGVSDALCQRILSQALSRGGDFADLYFEHTVQSTLQLKDGRVDQATGSVSLGMGVRTVCGDQTGYGFTQELDERSMLAVASTAATIAVGSASRVEGVFRGLSLENRYPVKVFFSDVAIPDKLPLVRRVHEKCFAASPLIAKATVMLQLSQKRILIVTSDGVKVEDLQPRGVLMAQVVAEKGGRKERAMFSRGGTRDFRYFTPAVADLVAKEVVDRVVTLFDAIRPPAGEIPVVLAPDSTGVLLHEAIGHGMEADFNRKEVSIYSHMIGKKVAEPFVNIVDDGTNPCLAGSINVDDEGTPGQRTVLVENGVLKGYLHDRISARHYSVQPTGNGRRESYAHMPMPRMRNTYMLSGPASAEEIIHSVKRGIYVQDVSNGQVMIGGGDFAFFVARGRMIEDGKLTAPIKDVNIMGNGPKMLQNITMAANDLVINESGAGRCGKNGQGVPVSFGLPTCLVKSMTVGGTQRQS